MEKESRILGLIPAKGSSTRLPRKNSRVLDGVSLLNRAINSARKSNLFDRISVSTEDIDIADEARSLNIEVPFYRPTYLAKDPYGVVDVALHALDAWEEIGEYFDTLVILLPTSPFRNAQDIIDAYSSFQELGVDFLHSVTNEEHSPLSSLVIKDGFLQPLFPEWIDRTGAKSNAETPKLVRANGAVTIVNVSRFRKEKNYYAYPLGAYEMPWERSIDVDTEQDFLWAQFVAQHILRSNA